MLDADGFFVEYVVMVLARLTADMVGSVWRTAECLRLSRLDVGEMVFGCAGFLSLVCDCSLESPQRLHCASFICLLRRSGAWLVNTCIK
jgi:hypothetical protein